MAFVVIALGAWTRLVDAGLGCPDWPGCYGFVTFPVMRLKLLLQRADIQCFHMISIKQFPRSFIDILLPL